LVEIYLNLVDTYNSIADSSNKLIDELYQGKVPHFKNLTKYKKEDYLKNSEENIRKMILKISKSTDMRIEVYNFLIDKINEKESE